MNKIYTILVMTDLTFDKQTKFPDFGSERLVGLYPELEVAQSAVTENLLDINECCYRYALIEECEVGVYHPAYRRWWFEYDKEKDEYFEIDEPEFVKGFCGFTIG